MRTTLWHPVVVGGLAGAVVSAIFAIGETSVSIGFGNSIALFALSLPWSVLTVALGSPLVSLLGLPERAAAHAVVYAMPVISGLVWGGLYNLGRNVVRSNRTYRNRLKSR